MPLVLVLLALGAIVCVRWMSTENTGSDMKVFETSFSSRKGEHNLPKFHSRFVGRDANVSKITSMLLSDQFVRAVHISGAPAIGKTRLAVEVGLKLVERGVDVRYIHVTEQWLWVQPNKPAPATSASSKSEKSTTALIKGGIVDMIVWAYAWVFPEQRVKDVLPAASDLVDWVKDLKFSTVVILDNCDDVLEGHLQDDLFNLIQTLHNTSSLVKTISASRVHFTPTGVTPFPLGVLDVDSSVDFLQQEWEKITKSEATKLAGLVGCNPLGLKLVAGLSRDMPTVQALIAELEDDSIKTLSCTSIPDAEKMESLITTSVDRLKEEIKLCAKNISLFPRSLSKEAGLSVLSGLGVKDITSCLNELFHRSLLEWYYLDDDSRYVYHQLISDFLKPSDYNYYYRGDSGFCVHYVDFYTGYVANLLKDCGIELTKHCKHWFRSEDENIRHVLDAMSYCPSQKKVKTLLQWRQILTNPVFWEFYDEETVSGLIHKELVLILKLYDSYNVDDRNALNSSGGDLNNTFSILSKQAIESNRAKFTYLRQQRGADGQWNYWRPSIVRELVNLCVVECQMYCTDSEDSMPSTYFHLCRLGCDRDCRYSITEMCFIAFFTSLLLTHVEQLLSHRGWRKTRYKWVTWIGLLVLSYVVALMASNTLAHYLSKLVQFCTSYALPLIEKRVGVTSTSDSRYLLITLLELVIMSASALASLEFGGLKSFLSFLVSPPILYYLSYYVSLPLSARVVAVLCVWFIGARTMSLLKWPFNVIILLVLVGQEQVLTLCPYLSDSSVWNTKSCLQLQTISRYT